MSQFLRDFLPTLPLEVLEDVMLYIMDILIKTICVCKRNGLLSEYFSLYRAASQTEGERREMIDA